MKVLSFRKFVRNTLKGFLEVELPSGMIVKDLTWHQRDDREWIGLPARKFEKENGTSGRANLIDFATKALYWQFVKEVLAALKAHVKQQPARPEAHREEAEAVPF